MPLFLSFQTGHDKCVEILLKHGVNPNLTNNSGCTLSYKASCNDHDKCVLLLLEHGDSRDVVTDKMQLTPLHLITPRLRNRSIKLYQITCGTWCKYK
jgi:ankyrin repeat protein